MAKEKVQKDKQRYTKHTYRVRKKNKTKTQHKKQEQYQSIGSIWLANNLCNIIATSDFT
jgi:hypothetical protein